MKKKQLKITFKKFKGGAFSVHLNKPLQTREEHMEFMKLMGHEYER